MTGPARLSTKMHGESGRGAIFGTEARLALARAIPHERRILPGSLLNRGSLNLAFPDFA